MSDKDHKSKSSHSSNSIKPHKLINYFIMPVVYTIVLLIVALPIELTLKDKIDINIVEGYEKANEHSFYDEVSAKRELPLSSVEDGTVTYEPIAINQGFGKIFSENAGINCEVYRGIEGKSNLREGVATVDAIPGTKDSVVVYGYSTKHFKKLHNVKVDDEVIFDTTYGKYRYRVAQIKTGESLDENIMNRDNTLIMYCVNGSEPFDNNRDDYLYVIADLVSGPMATEDIK